MDCTSTNDIVQALQQTDPTTLTIPYFILLHAILEATLPSAKSSSRTIPQALLPEGKVWPEITSGLLSFDPVQIRYVGLQLAKVVETVYLGAEQTGNYVPAIQLLQNVILRLDPTSSTFSLTHVYLIRCCVVARAYTEATTILDQPVYHISTSESTKALEKRLSKYYCSEQESSLGYINTQTCLSGKITSKAYLEYYLLGAICYISTAQWKKAQAFLEVVLVSPTQQNVASLLQVEAYKKFVLLGLIIDGNSHAAPRATNGNALKHIRILAKPYECIVDAFKTNDFEVLHAEIQEGVDQWNHDANFGLVTEVVAAFTKFAVIRLSKTFAALPIEEVSQRTSPKPEDVQGTLTYVQRLISSGELQAQITPSQTGSLGTVRFTSSAVAAKSETQVEQELTKKSAELKLLLKHIADYDHQMEVNKDYIDWLQKAKKARDQDKKAGQTGNSKPIGVPPGPDMDEDMMEDW